MNDPRRLLDECWRVEARTRGAAYGERYVAFLDLIGRLTGLSATAWETFDALYHRELRRHRPPQGDVHEWFSLVKARRG